MLQALARGASLRTADIGNLFAEGSGQINLMVLLLYQGLANLLPIVMSSGPDFADRK
jgi:hypothetical protein